MRVDGDCATVPYTAAATTSFLAPIETLRLLHWRDCRRNSVALFRKSASFAHDIHPWSDCSLTTGARELRVDNTRKTFVASLRSSTFYEVSKP